MGEYVNYLGSSMKIGTCENLYYTTFGKFRAAFRNGVLSQDAGSLRPADYLTPDSGFRFRFPFPDEDCVGLPVFQTLKDFERGLLITIDRDELFDKESFPANFSISCQVAHTARAYRIPAAKQSQ